MVEDIFGKVSSALERVEAGIFADLVLERCGVVVVEVLKEGIGIYENSDGICGLEGSGWCEC